MPIIYWVGLIILGIVFIGWIVSGVSSNATGPTWSQMYGQWNPRSADHDDD